MFFFVKIETQQHTFGNGVFVKYEESLIWNLLLLSVPRLSWVCIFNFLNVKKLYNNIELSV